MTTDLPAQRALIASLREVLPRADARTPVDIIETHISWVLLTGAFAYKIKKAVDLGFADFTTLAFRRHCCERELQLNRRLAPALYLEVVAIAGTVDAPVPGGSGPALEYAVRMREFPQSALASRVLARGELTPGHIDALAADVAAFHGRVDAADAAGSFGRPDDILGIALENCAATLAAADDADERAEIDALQRWTRREHAACAPRFARRRDEGFVRECHGDLHLGNMVLIDGRLTIFDCIEFNDGLRWIDVMSEVAFVVMDLHDRAPRRWRIASSTAGWRSPATTRAAAAAVLSRLSGDGARQGRPPAGEADGARRGEQRAARRVPRLPEARRALRPAAATGDRDHTRTLGLRQDDAHASGCWN